MKAPHPTPHRFMDMLMDENCNPKQAHALLEHILTLGGPEAHAFAAQLVTRARAGSGPDRYKKKLAELDRQIESIASGPLRLATFVSLVQPRGGQLRAMVKFEDGTTAFPAVLDEDQGGRFRRGSSLLLDVQAKLLIAETPSAETSGETAVLERRIGPGAVEVTLRGDEGHVFDASEELIDAVQRGDAAPGCRVRVCSRRRFAFATLPEADPSAHYRYLDRSPMPDVVVERDLGDPPAFIDELTAWVTDEMTDPTVRRSYRLPRSVIKLLAGISGSGKSFAVSAVIRRIGETVSEVTGVPLTSLPPRVMRFRPSTVLSQWLGESDKNIARFFEEARRLSAETVAAADGRQVQIPVILVLEEIDGLTRHRGGDAVYDRILTTLLELLDPARPEFQDRMILVLGTTNVPELIDMAFLRRIGGTVERFGRLTRRSFASVAAKKLAQVPMAENGDRPPEALRAAAVAELASWLYSPNGETPGQVALHIVGTQTPDIRYRRDFMTAGLVERAVVQASVQACRAQIEGCENPGLSAGALKKALDAQVQTVVDLLRADNVARYLELPEGVRVQSVEKIAQSRHVRLAPPRAAA